MEAFKRYAIGSLGLFVGATLIFGLGYPFFIIGTSSLISFLPLGKEHGGYSSSLDELARLPQYSGHPAYFWPRRSGTHLLPYNLMASGSSSQCLYGAKGSRILEERAIELGIPLNEAIQSMPDSITYSASGLDPHITLDNARFQSRRVAEARGISLEAVEEMIERQTSSYLSWLLFPAVVHVDVLNRELDRYQKDTVQETQSETRQVATKG